MFFGVQGAGVVGHPGLDGMLLAEYARSPLVLYRTKDDSSAGNIVSDQLYLHIGASIAFADRLLVHLDAPVALINRGDSPSPNGGTPFVSPDQATAGDVRAGARLRLFGEEKSPFQFALTGAIWFPTGDTRAYSGEDFVRGAPGLAVSGRFGSFVYAADGGVMFRNDATVANTTLGHELTFGLAAAALALDDKLQIGPELYGSAVVARGDTLSSHTSALEALLGAKYRTGGFTIGAAMGPGITRGIGTPAFRSMLTLGLSIVGDRDRDGILDHVDACPDVPGIHFDDPAKNGCPETDRDHDGIDDAVDACPDQAGAKTADPKTTGCPDSDADGIVDKQDACPNERGVPDADPAKNGCPIRDKDGDGILDPDDACPSEAGPKTADPKTTGCPDGDGDGIVDNLDACPTVKGVADADPKKNGCPKDTDNDGIPDETDACPTEPGKADPDPAKNGCPLVHLTATGIVILEQVQFETGKDKIKPESDDLLSKVAKVFVDHPELKKVLVEGHTDDRGNKVANKLLSERRATAVKKWLVKHGVDAKRLESKGFGQDKPIAPNTTDEGRQKNRRVEFKILDQGK